MRPSDMRAAATGVSPAMPVLIGKLTLPLPVPEGPTNVVPRCRHRSDESHKIEASSAPCRTATDQNLESGPYEDESAVVEAAPTDTRNFVYAVSLRGRRKLCRRSHPARGARHKIPPPLRKWPASTIFPSARGQSLVHVVAAADRQNHLLPLPVPPRPTKCQTSGIAIGQRRVAQKVVVWCRLSKEPK